MDFVGETSYQIGDLNICNNRIFDHSDLLEDTKKYNHLFRIFMSHKRVGEQQYTMIPTTMLIMESFSLIL